ncbi:DUF4102 domain-containing protein [Burkholderia cenocepacia]|nr:DUF4102 domain-containing protein [Burkholderia cenocepacia]RQU71844.1 DUF4102 domain-containing protein [Burkholderia cenocepacia]
MRAVNYVLTAIKLNAAKGGEKTYKLADGGGLFVRVTSSGTKTWCYSYRFADKRKDVTLGQYPEVSIKEARDRHFAARQQVEQGRRSDGREARREGGRSARGGSGRARVQGLRRAMDRRDAGRRQRGLSEEGRTAPREPCLSANRQKAPRRDQAARHLGDRGAVAQHARDGGKGNAQRSPPP